MEELKWIHNQSGTIQSIVFEGRKVELTPHERRQVIRPIADKFVEICDPFVIIDDEFSSRESYSVAEDVVWVANVTGSPRIPAKATRKVYDRNIRNWVKETVDNPYREPRDLKREIGGDQTIIQGRSGEEQRNNPSRFIHLPAYSRRPLSKAEATWWLRRSFMAAGHDGITGKGSPASIESRPPTEFEPNYQWDYDDVVLYASLVDSKLRFPTSAELRKDSKLSKRAKESAEAWEARFDAELTKRKRALIKETLFFYLVDPAVRLPTEEEFRAAKEQQFESLAG